MKAIVVYESLWGNTAAIARAIAEGLGPEARALSTAEASGAAIANADLIVAGAPVLAFMLPTDKLRESIGANPGRAPTPPDLSHPSMRSWLKALPKAYGRSAAFETRIRGPWGKSTPGIARGLEKAGYAPLAEPCSFIVTGTYGPLQDGELQRARLWGVELAKAME